MNAPLIDPFARAITYLRVSVTDRCDFRCVYCMSENMTFLPKKELLTLEELDRLCSTFVGLGVAVLLTVSSSTRWRSWVRNRFHQPMCWADWTCCVWHRPVWSDCFSSGLDGFKAKNAMRMPNCLCLIVFA